MKSASALFFLLLIVFAYCTPKKEIKFNNPFILCDLGNIYNTPDGATLDDEGNIILSIPNFNSASLYEQGITPVEYPAVMIIIDTLNNIKPWYNFKKEDLNPESGKIGPMDCAFGPDGHLYFNDNQFFLGKKYASRLMRIIIENGKPQNCEVLVKGFMLCNGLVWKDSTLYITESLLSQTLDYKNDSSQLSAVYNFQLDELNTNKVICIPEYDKDSTSQYLFSLIRSSGELGFGADGIAVDGSGNLFVNTFEDGTIYKFDLSSENTPKLPQLFATLSDSSGADGMVWRETDNSLYVADMFRNAIWTVDSVGEVKKIHENGDTNGVDGLLDAPAEVVFRNNELVVVNMDSYWDDPSGKLVNTKFDSPFTVSFFDLDK